MKRERKMLDIRNIDCRLGNFWLKDINLHIDEGSYFILLGPSGAGKTILFETIAGLVTPRSGSMLLNGNDITKKGIQHRDIGFVFQDGAVFPHLSVRDNIAYALRKKKIRKAEMRRRVNAIAEELSIGHLLGRKPGSLSGGERQRVAVARTLVLQPQCLLLDEPLSSLDIQLREGIRNLLRNINRKGMTIMHITHDFREAFALADHIAIIDRGRIIQSGTPREIYDRPGSAFVASFTGRRNFFELPVRGDGIPVRLKETLNAGAGRNDAGVIIPERSIELVHGSVTGDEPCFEALVGDLIRLPENPEIRIDCGLILHKSVPEEMIMQLGFDRGSRITVRFLPDRFIYVPANGNL